MRKYKLPKKIFNEALKVEMAFLVANLIWGAATPIIKYTIQYIPPMTFLFLRFLIVCILVLPATFIQLKKEPVHKSDYLNLFLLGLFAQTALILTFIALKYTSALDYTIISIFGTILTVYAGHHFYHEKISKGLVIGLVIASLGTLLIVLEPFFATNQDTSAASSRFLGNILGIFYALVWLVYIVWSKFIMGERSGALRKTLGAIHINPMKRSYSSTTIIFISFYVGLLTMIPLALLENTLIISTCNFSLLTIDIRGVLGLLYMALFSSITAYLLNQWGLERSKVSNLAIHSYLGVVFAIPFAFLLLGEVPNTLMVIGGSLIAVGVFIAEKNNKLSC